MLFLVLTLWSSHAALNVCNMRFLYPDADTAHCSATMSKSVAALFMGIGAMSWHAAYALRPVCWEVVFLLTKVLFVLPYDWFSDTSFVDERVAILAGLASALLRSVVVEGLRLLGNEMCVIVVIALAWRRSSNELVSSSAQEDMCLIDVDDPRFPIALWLGVGWAAAELIAGSYQLCKFLPLYRSVDRIPNLDEEDLLTDYVSPGEVRASQSDDAVSRGTRSESSDDDDDDDDDEMPLDEAILVREKAELEEQLGELLENVSPATITLWRLDSVLWNVGCTLMLSASLTHAQGCLGDPTTIGSTYAFVPFPSISAMWPTLLLLVSLHTVATTVWMVLLPRLGLISITYTTMLVGLALLSAGLGRWGALT